MSRILKAALVWTVVTLLWGVGGLAAIVFADLRPDTGSSFTNYASVIHAYLAGWGFIGLGWTGLLGALME